MMTGIAAKPLYEVARTTKDKILNQRVLSEHGSFSADQPVLVILAAGKGTRFGQAPKCAQKVCGVPLVRHSIEAFQKISSAPSVCLVGYRHKEVSAALGEDNIYVLTDSSTGGTAFAAYESFSIKTLRDANPLLVITMGDRVVPTTIFSKLLETHLLGQREADLTILSAIYEPPKNHGKGRILRDSNRKVLGIVEQRDIDGITDNAKRQRLLDLTEGNCPLYAARAATFYKYLSCLTNDNAQSQYYITDVVEAISQDGGEIRTITTMVGQPEYDLLCSDVTRPMDLALLEGVMTSCDESFFSPAASVEQVAKAIRANRPSGQVASIAAQLEELVATEESTNLGYHSERPVGIGIAGGRIRIAFMHPDMGRFFGPAWQMPFGAADASGREQIVILMQSSNDGELHLYPTDPQFREKMNSIPADSACMYPGEDIVDFYSYEGFGTRMAENLLLSLGYFSAEELQQRREKGLPLPPPSLWLENSMRRPFSLIGNAIVSMRTLREGSLGARVQTYLGREGFRGLRVMSTGNIPQGGFSSSSAVTVAVKNAINALFELGISADMLVYLACQAEYGTGVRAGALDQATEQKGQAGQGTLISSNPRESYKVLGTYPVPAGRFHVIFSNSVDRDRAAWKWSYGTYASGGDPRRLTALEMRKMTGKAAELAAILLKLPLDTDFFQSLEDDFVQNGVLSDSNLSWVYSQLQGVPLRISCGSLRQELDLNRKWYIQELMRVYGLAADQASEKTDATWNAIFSGWREPALRRTTQSGELVEETGVPLRAMLAYLFVEVAKNFHLIFHPEEWIECISRSQLGDRCFDINPDRLPPKDQMMADLDWEKGISGPKLMENWLDRFGATPFDFNLGLEDLSADSLAPLHKLDGTNFFRGLALIDLAEAMFKRAFGRSAVAVRTNAAGQGDFFQVHIDTNQVSVEEVKHFISAAFYRRFGLSPKPEFFEPHPGGGAVGVRLNRFDQLPKLIRELRSSGTA